MLYPLISIIIPVYNVQDYLVKCLDSCFSQTYPNIEIIAVDDGSTDNSLSILKEYAKKDSRLHVIRQRNQGVVIAREKALFVSKGQFVSFVDGDDFLEKNALFTLFKKQSESNADIVSGAFFLYYENKAKTRFVRNTYCGWSNVDGINSLLQKDCTWSLWGKLFKRHLFQSVPMPYSLKMGEDGVVCLYAHNNAKLVAFIDIPCYYYVQRKNSVTHQASDSRSVVEFIKAVQHMKSTLDWKGTKMQQSFTTFVLSQIFVYYVHNGERDSLLSYIFPFHVKLLDVFRVNLSAREKIGIFLFLYFPRMASLLRIIYIWLNR